MSRHAMRSPPKEPDPRWWRDWRVWLIFGIAIPVVIGAAILWAPQVEAPRNDIPAPTPVETTELARRLTLVPPSSQPTLETATETLTSTITATATVVRTRTVAPPPATVTVTEEGSVVTSTKTETATMTVTETVIVVP